MNDEIWQQLVAKLPWGHNLLLIEKFKDKKYHVGVENSDNLVIQKLITLLHRNYVTPFYCCLLMF